MTKFKVGDVIKSSITGSIYRVDSISSSRYTIKNIKTLRSYPLEIKSVEAYYTYTSNEVKPNDISSKEESKTIEKWVTCCLCNKRRYCHQIHNKSDWYCRICGEAPNNQRNKRGDLM